jgi:predicted peroxiredoxin
MATILSSSTWGPDDPTRATLPFLGALGAIEAGHGAEILLQAESTFLMKDVIANEIDGVGWPPLKELLPQVIEHGIPIYV